MKDPEKSLGCLPILFVILVGLALTAASLEEEWNMNGKTGILKVKELWVNGIKFNPIQKVDLNPRFKTIILEPIDTVSIGGVDYPLNTIALVKNKLSGEYGLFIKISNTAKKKWQRL